jgi:hypothetical protein
MWELNRKNCLRKANKATGLAHCTTSQLYIPLQADGFDLFVVYLTMLSTAKILMSGYGILPLNVVRGFMY